jgi:hypothetical protein
LPDKNFCAKIDDRFTDEFFCLLGQGAPSLLFRTLKHRLVVLPHCPAADRSRVPADFVLKMPVFTVSSLICRLRFSASPFWGDFVRKTAEVSAISDPTCAERF